MCEFPQIKLGGSLQVPAKQDGSNPHRTVPDSTLCVVEVTAAHVDLRIAAVGVSNPAATSAARPSLDSPLMAGEGRAAFSSHHKPAIGRQE